MTLSHDPNTTSTLSVEDFWRWLKIHHNCIVRAGGAGFALFDMPDIHWHIDEEEDGLLAVQLIRGKELLSEMVAHKNDLVYVQAAPDEGDQVAFDCIGTGPEGEASICYFIMAHGYDEEEIPSTPRWTH